MGSEQNQLQILKIDFSGLNSNNPVGHGWEAARSQVTEALESYGCFEAVFRRITSEIREELFGEVIPDLFKLPLEAKMRNADPRPYMGYVGQIPTMAYESLRVDNVSSLESVEEFTNLMWPGGNPTFCNAVWRFSKQLQDLIQMIHRMVLEGLGTEKYYDSHIESITTALRLSEYGVPLDQETKIALGAHQDPTLVSIICQHQVEGLEVQARDGEWIQVTPLPNSFTVMIGEAFRAWSNGRLEPPYHRVKMSGNDKRYCAIFATRPSHTLQPPEELADEEHPLLFKPFNYGEYMKFRYSEEGKKYKDTLKAYCGVGSEVEA